MWYLILSLLIVIYMLFNLILSSFFSSPMGAYVFKPIIWISLAVIVFLIANQEGLSIWKFKKIRRWQFGRSPFYAALLIGGFQVSLLVMAGLLVGFGSSPYSHTPVGILTNIVFIGSALIALELSRAYLIKKGMAAIRNITLVLGLISILFMFIAIRPLNYTILNINEPATIAQLIGESILPLFAMSLFASYLAYLGGALAAMGYIGILQAFEWFAPVLPNIDWALAALIGTIGPAIGFFILQSNIQISQVKKFKGRRRKKIKDPALGWIAIAIVSVLLIFFSFGHFGIQPTVISSGSMQPSIETGDIALVLPVPIDTIEEGDIIQYRVINAQVIHRVHSVFGEDEGLLFITKGDANNAPDDNPVSPDQVIGKVVFNIPKIGWIPLFFKSIFKEIGFTV